MLAQSSGPAQEVKGKTVPHHHQVPGGTVLAWATAILPTALLTSLTPALTLSFTTAAVLGWVGISLPPPWLYTVAGQNSLQPCIGEFV